MTNNEELITFGEFEALCAGAGHPLYVFGGKLEQGFKDACYHYMSAKVSPRRLLPAETLSVPDYSNVARLPKKEWHSYYAAALWAWRR